MQQLSRALTRLQCVAPVLGDQGLKLINLSRPLHFLPFCAKESCCLSVQQDNKDSASL